MDSRVKEILEFTDQYKKSSNAATGSKYDANANVTLKSLGTLGGECVKKLGIDVQREVAKKYITKKFGEDLANQYISDLANHLIYTNDESSLSGMPYCCSISLYPFLLDGLKNLGGSSDAPKHANSFIGGLINLIFLCSSQFAGAVAIPEFLPYFDHFLRVDYGNDYFEHLDEVIESFGNRHATLRDKIEDWFQQFVYCINQPAGSRNVQSPFTNIAYYDRYYFESIFKDFVFPDFDEPNFESTNKLQKMFMRWFSQERYKEVLTFPVETVSALADPITGKYKDEDMADFVAEMMAEGHNPFLYQSDSADALSSCCRLRNAVDENIFSFSLGTSAIKTGSKRVISINIPRITQNWFRSGMQISLAEYITPIIKRVHCYLEAWNDKLWDDFNAKLLPVYSAEYIDLDKQYLTVGLIGLEAAASFLQTVDTCYSGLQFRHDNQQYKQFVKDVLLTIKNLNKAAKTDHIKINSEMIPAEGSGPKMYHWDKEDGYWVNPKQNCYNSYFYPVEDETIDPIEKLYLHGKDFTGCLDGGSACHINLQDFLDKDQYRYLMDIAIKAGCNYWTVNVPMIICNKCGHISKKNSDHCEKCGSNNIDKASRIIGYLKRISCWSEPRQIEESNRYYDDGSKVVIPK